MDKTDTLTDEQAVLSAQRAYLRAFADKMLAALEGMPKPQSFIDIARALRAVMVADRALVRLYTEPKAACTRVTKPAVRTEASAIRPAPQPTKPAMEASPIQVSKAPLESLLAQHAYRPARTATALHAVVAAAPQLGLPPKPYGFAPP